MSQRTKPTKKKSPSKRKPKKTWLDCLRRFLAKNRDIDIVNLLINLLILIFTALSFFFLIYFSSAKTKPETQPKPRFEMEEPPSAIPVQIVNRKCPSNRPA